MLRARLYLGLLPLLLLFILVLGVTTLLYRNLARSLEKDLDANYRSMIGGYEMRDAATNMAGALAGVRRGDLEEAKRAYATHRSRFRQRYMEQSLLPADGERAVLLEQLDAVARQFDALAKELFAHGGDGSLAALREREGVLFGVLSTLEELTQNDYEKVRAAGANATRLARTSVHFIIGATVGAILLSLFLSYRLARSLSRPIEALSESAVAFGEGRLEHDVPVTTQDELGDLARAFNAMAAKLRDYRDAMTERVTRARRTMEATLTSTPDPLFVVNTDGHHEVRNPAAEKIAALPEFSGGFPPSLEKPLRDVLATGTHYLPTGYDQVVTLHVGDGERHYLPRILAIGDTLTDFGGAAVVLQDVTKFRLLDDVKGNLVSTVSHELKTPLTSLLMAVHMLLEESFGAINAKQRDLLHTARDNADRLLRILNDLLDLSRLESGASALRRNPVRAEELLNAVADEIRGITDAAAQTIEVCVASGVGEVRVDAERMRHVFVNLLTNASKYSGSDTTITLYAEPAADGFVRFGVHDQGPGIPPESLPHVFDRFYRVPDQCKKGAGLGLAICREIVVAHGGSIKCVCEPGQGCDFTFVLPRQ